MSTKEILIHLEERIEKLEESKQQMEFSFLAIICAIDFHLNTHYERDIRKLLKLPQNE